MIDVVVAGVDFVLLCWLVVKVLCFLPLFLVQKSIMSSGRAFSALPPLGKGKENPTQRGRSSPAITSIEKKSNSVFRYGETMESLFDVRDDSDPEYLDVCDDLASSGPCPELWLRVLQLTHLRGSSLLRLYRRATNRFPMNENEESVHTLEIWLSYARLVSNQSEILDYVGKVAWSRKHAMYFVCRAELDQPNARDHLRRGLSQNACPREALDKALVSLNSGNNTTSADSKPSNNMMRTSDSSQTATDMLKSKASLQQETKKRRALQPISDSVAGSVISDRKSNSPLAKLDLTDRVVSSLNEQTKTVHREEKESDGTKELKDSRAAFHLKPIPCFDSKTPLSHQPFPPPKRSEKPPLSSRRLRPAGKLGKPARAEPNAIKRVHEEEEETEPSTKNRPSKFTKKDLAYMFDWNPEERNGSSGNTQEEVTAKSNNNTNSSNEHDEEEEPRANDEPRPVDTSSPSNSEFVRLISERNMIQVNGVSYMKLDVIGKGGSSKVYRVMSSDAKIWAIKKVSLGSETLRQDTLNGYLNEIGLLKRLSSNPSIINLGDSEIIPDKLIYMVMEVGEADLNFVLQQQRKSSTLNLNFVRLTWYQMLKAVHSIHEARIIHGKVDRVLGTDGTHVFSCLST